MTEAMRTLIYPLHQDKACQRAHRLFLLPGASGIQRRLQRT